MVLPLDELASQVVEWWEPEPVFKLHYQVTLENGRELGIFRNVKTET
jgi:hypothetical protein